MSTLATTSNTGCIISLSGLIGSGKNAVAEYLVKEHGFVQESFAGSLKDAVAKIFGWDRTMLEGSTPEARTERDKIDTWWAARLNLPHLTPRWVLQYFGTDTCREHFHTDIWLASVENKLRQHSANKIVISDSRFVNELTMLKGLGSITAVVKRGAQPEWWPVAENAYKDPAAMIAMTVSDIHQSEWDWAGFNFDVTINNNSTLAELYSHAANLVTRNQQ